MKLDNNTIIHCANLEELEAVKKKYDISEDFCIKEDYLSGAEPTFKYIVLALSGPLLAQKSLIDKVLKDRKKAKLIEAADILM